MAATTAPGFPERFVRDGPSLPHGGSDRGSGHSLGLTIALAQAEVLDTRLG